ncbi:hypothetical protein E3T61_04650 [Cryobacterium lactosi]|uniref:Uncharacterized protein n=1 Tax=Cryobacterium lactosi TaxID=1259202 RepID=A0A4R9BYM0_9MICO|nr:hypothetical protein [Cryobacterium lactosi]TFD93387.1 hypothetical protein E3T61_04650 [Cryobacterium lactosi]
MAVDPAALDPAVLLAGPRGRRLCLEWARTWSQNDDERLSSAIFYAAHNLDPGRGVSRVLFSVGTDGSDRDADHGSKPPAPGDVARLLADASLTEPGGPAVMSALAAAVGNARYWQPPDGEDVLAAAPEMRAALARVAHLLAGSPQASWWTTPAGGPARDAEQWSVEFAGTTVDGELVRNAAEILELSRVGRVEEEALAERDWPADPRASFSGPWWSKPPSALTRTTRALAGVGPAGLALVEDALGWEAATVHRIRPPRDTRVYEIDGPDAWAHLCRRYPVRVTAARRQVWYQTTGRIGLWVMPDWAGVAQDVDAVHLTVAGYLATAGRTIQVDGDVASVLAGWDPDQTYWLTDVDHDHSTDQVWHRGESEWARATDA